MLAPWKKSYDQPRQHIKKQRHYFANKVCLVFPVVMYGFESWTLKESWVPKNWCFWTVVLEKTLESPLDCKEIQPVHPKGNQSWIFIGRTDAEAEAPVLWPPDAKNQLLEKDPDAGKDWRQEEKGTRGWDGWMASLTRWTWFWASSRSWWQTGKPCALQSMGSQSRTWLSNYTTSSSVGKQDTSTNQHFLCWKQSLDMFNTKKPYLLRIHLKRGTLSGRKNLLRS